MEDRYCNWKASPRTWYSTNIERSCGSSEPLAKATVENIKSQGGVCKHCGKPIRIDYMKDLVKKLAAGDYTRSGKTYWDEFIANRY